MVFKHKNIVSLLLEFHLKDHTNRLSDSDSADTRWWRSSREKNLWNGINSIFATEICGISRIPMIMFSFHHSKLFVHWMTSSPVLLYVSEFQRLKWFLCFFVIIIFCLEFVHLSIKPKQSKNSEQLYIRSTEKNGFSSLHCSQVSFSLV